jgi:hypothetical protein
MRTGDWGLRVPEVGPVVVPKGWDYAAASMWKWESFEVGSRNAEVGKKEGEKVGRLEGGRIKVEGGKERRWEDRKVRRWEKAGLSDEDWGLRVPEVGID